MLNNIITNTNIILEENGGGLGLPRRSPGSRGLGARVLVYTILYYTILYYTILSYTIIYYSILMGWVFPAGRICLVFRDVVFQDVGFETTICCTPHPYQLYV